MEKDETVAAHEKRRQQVYADNDDVLVRVLDIPEAAYECVMVNSSGLARGLLEGDIILFAARDNPEEGEIVLIEEEQYTRLGIASVPPLNCWPPEAFSGFPSQAAPPCACCGVLPRLGRPLVQGPTSE